MKVKLALPFRVRVTAGAEMEVCKGRPGSGNYNPHPRARKFLSGLADCPIVQCQDQTLVGFKNGELNPPWPPFAKGEKSDYPFATGGKLALMLSFSLSSVPRLPVFPHLHPVFREKFFYLPDRIGSIMHHGGNEGGIGTAFLQYVAKMFGFPGATGGNYRDSYIC